MTLKSSGPILAACMAAFLLAGCSTAPQSRDVTPFVKKLGPCEWDVDTVPGGKVVNLTLTKGADKGCTVTKSKDELWIGDEAGKVKKVIQSSPAEFLLPGSCTYCYINPSGGLICIVYPSC